MLSGSRPVEAMRSSTRARPVRTCETRASLAEEAGEVVIATDVEEVVIGGAGEDVATRTLGHDRLARGERSRLGGRVVVETRGDHGHADRFADRIVDDAAEDDVGVGVGDRVDDLRG